MRKELEISGIQNVKPKHEQNRINHLERMATSDFRNTPSATNLEEEEIVDAPGNNGNASMPEQFQRPNPWRKMMMMMMMMMIVFNNIFPENHAVYEIMWNDLAEPDRSQMDVGASVLNTGYLRLQRNTQNMKYFLLFHNNNGCTNAPQCYVIRLLPVVFILAPYDT
jgi:hypothetical protein